MKIVQVVSVLLLGSAVVLGCGQDLDEEAAGVQEGGTDASDPAAVAKAHDGAQVRTARYIVVLKDTVSDPAAVAAEHGRAHGFTARFVYRHALRGYAATLPEAAVARIAARPEVKLVSADREVRGPRPPTQGEPQIVSKGVLRIDGDTSSTRSGSGRGEVDINVAVLDTGPIDASHPDLNVAATMSCLQRSNPPRPRGDNGGHATMVAGFIGARDNSFGRVGVAPGARIWGVEVFDERGWGLDSEFVCGIDWVASTRTDADPSNDIAVVNYSGAGTLTPPSSKGSCSDARGAQHLAICGLVDSGVVLVAAAGNESTDIQNISPATYDDVLAVTAMADSDGMPGALGAVPFMCLPPQTTEDSAAFFSNFATLAEDRVHTVAAPGVCISSTYPGGLYAVDSGTSFSAPLAAGTVALCIASGSCAGLTPRQIIQKIVGDAAAYNNANPGYGFQGDPLRPVGNEYYGYLIRAGSY